MLGWKLKETIVVTLEINRRTLDSQTTGSAYRNGFLKRDEKQCTSPRSDMILKKKLTLSQNMLKLLPPFPVLREQQVDGQDSKRMVCRSSDFICLIRTQWRLIRPADEEQKMETFEVWETEIHTLSTSAQTSSLLSWSAVRASIGGRFCHQIETQNPGRQPVLTRSSFRRAPAAWREN